MAVHYQQDPPLFRLNSLKGIERVMKGWVGGREITNLISQPRRAQIPSSPSTFCPNPGSIPTFMAVLWVIPSPSDPNQGSKSWT